MFVARNILCVIVACGFVQAGLAQQPVPPARQSANKPPLPTRAENDALRQQRRLAVAQMHSFAERVLSFSDVETKITTIVSLADTLWPFDEHYARQLFLKAHELARGLKPTDAKGQTAGATLTAGKIVDLRGEVITVLARHDTPLARRLSEADAHTITGSDLAGIEQRAAADLLRGGNAPQAIEFAERSLQAGVPRQMIGFLLQLRRQNAAQADELYAKTLNRLVTEPNVDGLSLMELGVYVFTSPLLTPDMEQMGAMVVQPVENVGVINLAADRPGIPPGVVRAYLAAAAQILLRPVTDPRQQKLYYITGYQLLPKAQKLTPDLAPQIVAAMQRLTPDVPAALTQATTYNVLAANENYKFDDTLSELDDIADEGLHDRRCVMIANGLCFSADFARARVVAEKVKAPVLRSRLLNLINANDAVGLLGRGQTTEAELLAGKLAPGIERAALWLALARARAKEADMARFSEALNMALKDARRLDDARQPYLILNAAGELARTDPALALQILNEAVGAFNTKGGKPAKWVESVEAGGQQFSFSFKGLEGDGISASVGELFAVDAQGTVSAVLSLKPEQTLGRALRAWAKNMLGNATQKKTS